MASKKTKIALSLMTRPVLTVFYQDEKLKADFIG